MVKLTVGQTVLWRREYYGETTSVEFEIIRIGRKYAYGIEPKNKGAKWKKWAEYRINMGEMYFVDRDGDRIAPCYLSIDDFERRNEEKRIEHERQDSFHELRKAIDRIWKISEGVTAADIAQARKLLGLDDA